MAEANEPMENHLTMARLALLVSLLALGAAQAVAQTPAEKPLLCAVDGSRELKPARLCEQLGQALGRPMELIDDARKAGRGESLQILRDDVRWTLILLQDGVVRSWTRISVVDARGREVNFFARAARGLLRASPKPKEKCVRLEPRSEKSARSMDLVYPWEELRACVRKVAEVVDPWWNAPGR